MVAGFVAGCAGGHGNRLPIGEAPFIGCPEGDEVSVERLLPAEFMDRGIRTPMPDYPSHCRCQGTVLIKVLVDKHGKVACLTVAQGHPLLTSPAMEALKQWTFRPLRRDGRAVRFSGLAAITFESAGGVSINRGLGGRRFGWHDDSGKQRELRSDEPYGYD